MDKNYAINIKTNLFINSICIKKLINKRIKKKTYIPILCLL